MNLNYNIDEGDIRFPTFLNIDKISEKELTSEYLLKQFEFCHENFIIIFKYFNYFFDINKYFDCNLLIQNLLNNKIEYYSLVIYYYLFDRQIQFFYDDLNIKLFNSQKISNLIENKIKIKIFQSKFENFYNEILNIFPFFSQNNLIDKNQIEKIYFQEQKMLNEYSKLDKNFIPSITTLNIATKIINLLLENIKENFNKIRNEKEKKFNDLNKDELIKFYSDLNKIELMSSLFFYFYFLPSENIFNKEINSKEWMKLKKHYKRIIAFPDDEIKLKIKKMTSMINVGMSAFNQVEEENLENNYYYKAKVGLLMAFYFFNKDKANIKSLQFLIKPKTKVTQKIWNILEIKEIKNAMKIILPSISFSKKFYFKKIENEISKENIENYYENIKNNNFQYEENNKNIQINFEGENNNLIVNQINNNIYDENNDPIFLQKFPSKTEKKSKYKNYVKVKVIHSQKLLLSFENNYSFFDILCCCFPKKQNLKNSTKDSIIIHIHGGGFIAMSSSSHEMYTRKWANGTGIPVFSIDYRLSPQVSFPKALDDVYQTYLWIINYCEDIFNLTIKNIFLTGDSAGGNLALALNYLLIYKNIQKKPNLLLLAYPAVKISMNPMSLSYLNSLTDPILEASLLKFCLNSYVGDFEDEKNPFLSPLYMNDNVLEKLPVVKIYGGSADPLRDDYIEFTYRLINCGVDCELKEIKYFPHGFLNYDIFMMLTEAGIVNEMIINDINNFLNKNSN